MNRTAKDTTVLNCLIQAGPLTVDQIRDITGLDGRSISSSLRRLAGEHQVAGGREVTDRRTPRILWGIPSR